MSGGNNTLNNPVNLTSITISSNTINSLQYSTVPDTILLLDGKMVNLTTIIETVNYPNG